MPRQYAEQMRRYFLRDAAPGAALPGGARQHDTALPLPDIARMMAHHLLRKRTEAFVHVAIRDGAIAAAKERRTRAHALRQRRHGR